MRTLKQVFFYSSMLILVITAVAKLYTLTGGTKILSHKDPLLQVDYRWILLTAGLAELIVAWIIAFNHSSVRKYVAILWLCSNFVFYRLGFLWLGLSSKMCPCLGNLTDTLGISPANAETVLKGLLIYMTTGAVIGLWAELAARKKPLQDSTSIFAKA